MRFFQSLSRKIKVNPIQSIPEIIWVYKDRPHSTDSNLVQSVCIHSKSQTVQYIIHPVGSDPFKSAVSGSSCHIRDSEFCPPDQRRVYDADFDGYAYNFHV